MSSSDLIHWKYLKSAEKKATGVFRFFDDMVSDKTFYRTMKKGIQSIITMENSPTMPLARTVIISTTEETEVRLASFVIKSQNVPLILQSLQIILIPTKGQVTNIFSEVTLRIGGRSHTTSLLGVLANHSDTNRVTLSFENVDEALLADQYVTVDAWGKVKPNIANSIEGAEIRVLLLSNGTEGGSMNNPVAEDPFFQKTSAVNSVSLQSATIAFTSTTVFASNLLALTRGGILERDGKLMYAAELGFTITSLDRDIYLDGGVRSIFEITSISDATLEINSMHYTPEMGDTAQAFLIRAGTSRSFTFDGIASRIGKGNVLVKVTAIRYGFSPVKTTENQIDYGLAGFGIVTFF